MSELWANNTDHYLPEKSDADDEVEQIETRKAVPVPHAYVHMLFERELTPRQAWRTNNLGWKDG